MFKVATNPDGLPSVVREAIYRILYSFARIMIRFGVGYRQISPILKQALVDAAKRDSGLDGKSPTKNRVALLSQLTIHEVNKYYASSSPVLGERMDSMRILDQWSRDNRYSDGDGKPLDLPFESEVGRSFANLCKEQTTTYTPKTILEELQSCGAVEILPNNQIRFVRIEYVPESEYNRLALGLQSISQLVDTIQHNLSEDPPMSEDRFFYQQSVKSRFIPRSRVDQVRKSLRSKLHQWNRDAADILDANEAQSHEVEQDTVGVGLVYFQTLIEDK